MSRFQQDFFNLTSGNEFIGSSIQKSQLNAQYTNQVLEWIPYNRFKNIEYLDKGRFSVVYKAIWLDGDIKGWSNVERQCIRNNNKTVALKSLDKSSNLNE